MNAIAPATDVLDRRYGFVVIPEADGWHIRFPDLPGCTSFAESFEDIGPMARASFEIWIESEVEQGHQIPEPSDVDPASGWSRASFVVPDLPDSGTDSLLTAEDAAAALGVSRRRINQIAATRGVGRTVGNARVFSEADVNALKPGQRGRPRRTVTQ